MAGRAAADSQARRLVRLAGARWIDRRIDCRDLLHERGDLPRLLSGDEARAAASVAEREALRQASAPRYGRAELLLFPVAGEWRYLRQHGRPRHLEPPQHRASHA